jgi:hypothetical protein
MATLFCAFKTVTGFGFYSCRQITQKMGGGAKRRHPSFGFYVLSKTYIAIAIAPQDAIRSFKLE